MSTFICANQHVRDWVRIDGHIIFIMGCKIQPIFPLGQKVYIKGQKDRGNI